MKTVSIFKEGGPRTPRPKSISDGTDTAYWIFDPAVLFQYQVTASHLKMSGGMGNLPIPYDGTNRDMNRITSELITISGTIWKAVTFFVDGASIDMSSETAAKMYTRITAHIAKHLELMRTERGYMWPDRQDFDSMSEFAMAIRTMALVANPNLDSAKVRAGIFSNSGRPSLLSVNKSKLDNSPPRILSQMDAIDKYAALYGG